MLHTGRSGSVLLGHLLDAHPRICWGGEVIERMLHRTSYFEDVEISDLNDRLSLKDGINEIEKRMTSLCGPRIFGLEIQDYHVNFLNTDLGSLIDALRSLGFNRYIILDRENPLRKLVSHLVAAQRGVYHQKNGSRVHLEPLQIDPDRVFLGYRYSSVTEALDRYENFMRQARELLTDATTLEIWYERDIRDDPLVAYRKACDFLGLEPKRPEIKFGRTTPYGLDRVIANYQELAERLAPTRHGWMLPQRIAELQPD